jgi:tetratricopeptide (TPR) repeat protein
VFDIRFKQIEAALNDGRLDGAWDMLQDPDVRGHRAGQKLLGQLTQAYLKRGREHLDAGNFDAALGDCGRAEKLGGNLPETAQLRTRLAEAIGQVREARSIQAERLRQAQKQLGQGWFSGVHKVLDGYGDRQAVGLKEAAQAARAEYDSLIGRIEESLESRDVMAAARLHQKLAGLGGQNSKFSDLRNRIESMTCQEVGELLKAGQLEQAAVILGAFGDLCCQWRGLQPLGQAIFYCRKGAESLHLGQFNQAVVELKKAQMLYAGMGWLGKVIEQAGQAARACEAIEISPLGILQMQTVSTREQPQYPRISPVEAEFKNKAYCTMDKLVNAKNAAARYLLQIDGVGACVVVVGDSVTLGPISSKVRPDIGFVTSPDEPARTIERMDGDYFLSPGKKLLCEGDKIDISPRCRMKFSMPNPASGTACLALSSAKLPRSDIQSIILLDREMIVGPARNCHIQSGQVDETMTFFVRVGKLFYQGSQAVLCDGIAVNPQDGIATGRPVAIGSLRIVWTEYTG